jgi:hypothetical protein
LYLCSFHVYPLLKKSPKSRDPIPLTGFFARKIKDKKLKDEIKYWGVLKFYRQNKTEKESPVNFP